MKKSIFLTILTVVFLIFAVISFGGCGGSSSHFSNEVQNPDEQKPDEQKPDEQDSDEMPSLLGGFGSPEFEYVSAQLEEELAEAGLTVPEMHAVIIFPGEMALLPGSVDQASGDLMSSTLRNAITLKPVKGATTLPQEELDRIGEVLKPYYESGDVILMFFPTPETINDLYVGLGEKPMYLETQELLSLDNEADSRDIFPEIYAVAKRYNGNSPHYFSHVVPGNIAMMLGTLIEMLSDDVSQDISEEGAEELSELGDEISDYIYDGSISEEYKGFRGAYIFQARRYAALLRWAANIDVKMKEQEEYVSESQTVKAAAAGNVLSYSAQNETINCDYYEAKYNWKFWGEHSISYTSGLDETVYAFHNFTDKNDYYIVRSKFSVKPDFDKRTDDNGIFTVGSMAYFDCAHTIDGADSYSIIENMPSMDMGQSDSKTNYIRYKTPDFVGFNTKTGAGTNQGTSYASFHKWETTEWYLLNKCDESEAKWQADFYGGSYWKYWPYYDGDVSEASKSLTELYSEWIWKVSGASVTMRAKPFVVPRDTQRYKNTKSYSIHGTSQTKYLKLVQPPHAVISQTSYEFGKDGGDDEITLICPEDWIVSCDKDWLSIEEDEGEGSLNEQTINFSVDSLSTGEKKRIAKITISAPSTGESWEIKITQNNK